MHRIKLEVKREHITNENLPENMEMKPQVILNAINNLKDNYRISLNLHLIEGYDYEEISEIMNITYENSRTTISRAKSKLRSVLTSEISIN